MSELTNMDFGVALLEKEWVLSIQAPMAGLDVLLEGLRAQVELRQGNYDNCLQVSASGEQQFRALEGSHAGAEQTIQSTPVVDITFSISPDKDMLKHAISVIFEFHVHEEPTIRVTEAWATRAKDSGNKNNPNKYWNREDAKEIHGTAIAPPEDKS